MYHAGDADTAIATLLGGPSLDDVIGDEGLHDFAILIVGRVPNTDEADLRPRLRRTRFDDFTFDPQHIAGPDGLRPTKFIDPAADHAAGWPEVAVDDEPHRRRHRVPAACRQSCEEGGLGNFLVEVERLRIVFAGKRLDGGSIEYAASRRKASAGH